MYRFSRHPMYLSMLLVYLGVSAASLSWLFTLLTAATFLLQRYQAIVEECYCAAKFGDACLDYRKVTARWFTLP